MVLQSGRGQKQEVSTSAAGFYRGPEQFQEQINMEQDYFSSIARGGAPVECLIHFLSKESILYDYLEDHAKTIIQHVTDNNNDAKCLGWFIKGNLDEHASDLDEWISGETCPEINRRTWLELIKISDSPEWLKLVISLANNYYTRSVNYDTADIRFNDVIRPLLESFEIDDCIDLIEKIQNNDQTWERSRAKADHSELRARAIELFPDFDSTQYRVFNRRLD